MLLRAELARRFRHYADALDQGVFDIVFYNERKSMDSPADGNAMVEGKVLGRQWKMHLAWADE